MNNYPGLKESDAGQDVASDSWLSEFGGDEKLRQHIENLEYPSDDVNCVLADRNGDFNCRYFNEYGEELGFFRFPAVSYFDAACFVGMGMCLGAAAALLCVMLSY